MTKIVVATTAIYGHVAPMLTITQDLLARGHEVVFLTGSAFAARVAAKHCELALRWSSSTSSAS
ncbi:hypothetical protein [Curtobacterium sp. MCBA15_008]|uniref:hypothetical protein n=1 Tax=Curtobacterium sp. MCBA15_008 TaxID=1898736 RepID=UPI0008DCF4B0|nr:hypothetical protein [Curtobacterium sp. MCBA15_008]OII13210.1 hypothetical protein BIU96_14670 [Curtobacterium sp. MCBA15_008]